MKICRICQENKEDNLLVPSGVSRKSGETLYKNICKKCWNRRREEKRKVNKSESRIQSEKKRWSDANSGERGKIKRLKLKYNLSLEDYDKMIESQNNKCNICKEEMIVPNVDHCHTTGRVRGLLCTNCNTTLGRFKDSKEILKSAIEYLEKSDCIS